MRRVAVPQACGGSAGGADLEAAAAAGGSAKGGRGTPSVGRRHGGGLAPGRAALAFAGLLLLLAATGRRLWQEHRSMRAGSASAAAGGPGSATAVSGTRAFAVPADGGGGPLPFPPRRVHDALLRAAVAACAEARDTYVFVDPAAPAIVATADFESAVAARPCPPVDIMLAPEHRSIGLCTDAALYMHLLGARLLPGPAALPMAAYEAACPQSGTVRLSLEPLYEEWVAGNGSNGGGAVQIFAPNFENAYESDRQLHARMDLVLCKVRRCEELFAPYLRDLNSSAQIIYTGHTAIDPASAAEAAPLPPPPPAPGPPCKGGWLRRCGHQHGSAGRAAAAGQAPPSQQQQQAPLPTKPDYGAALHVRGKSELKHTAQLLECWARHPEWPRLTVIGPLPNPQIDLAATRRFLAAPNIVAPHPGVPNGPNWPAFDPAAPRDLAALQLGAGIHVCPSEREGYGLYIAEARAAGALVIAPDHPPMNELVTESNGVFIEPDRTFSQPGPPVPALARYGNISASVSPEAICRAVERALALPLEKRLALGRAARRDFFAERAQLLVRMDSVRAAIEQLLLQKRRAREGGPGAESEGSAAGALARRLAGDVRRGADQAGRRWFEQDAALQRQRQRRRRRRRKA